MLLTVTAPFKIRQWISKSLGIKCRPPTRPGTICLILSHLPTHLPHSCFGGILAVLQTSHSLILFSGILHKLVFPLGIFSSQIGNPYSPPGLTLGTSDPPIVLTTWPPSLSTVCALRPAVRGAENTSNGAVALTELGSYSDGN